jgi:hypothetical protein
MAVGYNPRAITDGLVLALDAGNPKNYNVGISTNWTDKVGGNNGTLVGGTYHTDGPFVGAGYVEFDGTGDTLTLSNTADHQFGSSDYTIESWVYLNNLSTVQGLFGRYNTSSAREIYITFNTNGSITHRTSSNGTSFSTHSTSVGLLTANTWHHVAISKSGTTSYIAVDGVVVTGTVDATLHSASQTTYIGDAIAGSNLLNGNLSNYRILKGTALYTANFTPPTKPLTAITNTTLLTCQGNTIADASSSAHTITANGDISLTKEPFAGAGAVSFDGNSDSLTVPASVDFVLDGQFTLEFWIYLNTIILDTQNPSPLTFSQNGSNTGQIYLNVSNKFFSLWNGSSDIVTTGNNSITTGRWYHVAATRDASNDCRIFLDGVLSQTASSTHTFGNASGDLRIGSFNGTGGDVDGYLSNLRILKGTALYTSNFTPPAEPLTAVTNTELLTCQGQNIKDASSNSHAITVNGDAKATIVSSSFEFDGTDDYVDCGTSTDFDFGTGNYTIEAWIYINDGVQQYHGIFGSSGTGSDSFQFQLQDEKIRLSSYTTEILVSDAADVVPFTQWTHVAISRSGTGATDTKLYKNGSLIKSGQDNINWGSYSRQIGRVFSNNAYDLYGKIAQVKVYKGKALSTAEVTQNYNATKGRYA